MTTKLSQNNSLKIPALRFAGFNDVFKEKKLNNLVRIYDGTHQTPNYVKEGIPFYSVEHVTANDFSKTKFISEEVFKKENKKVEIEKGDLLMTRIGDIGTVRLIDWDVRASFYVSLALLKQSEKINSSYLSQYIKTTKFQNELWKRTIHVAFPKKINLGEIGECSVTFPSLIEQKKIASLLESIDSWLNNLRTQKDALREYKKGMMQKIFSQEIRFKDAKSKTFPKWEETKLEEILKERKEYSTKGKGYTHISLTTKGVVPKSERYDRDFLVGNDETKGYKITRLNDLCYNPANLKFGVISINKLGAGIFSPIYVTFEIVGQDIDFVGYYLIRDAFINKARKYEQGTVYERMAVHPSDLVKVKVLFPSVPEQKIIAEFLGTIDRKIEIKAEQITYAEQWKRGLMQQLFI